MKFDVQVVPFSRDLKSLQVIAKPIPPGTVLRFLGSWSDVGSFLVRYQVVGNNLSDIEKDLHNGLPSFLQIDTSHSELEAVGFVYIQPL